MKQLDGHVLAKMQQEAQSTQRHIDSHNDQYSADKWWEFQMRWGLTDEELERVQQRVT